MVNNRKTKNALIKKTHRFRIDEPVYAKLRFYCPWPAKIIHFFDRWCDVRFFGVPERWAKLIVSAVIVLPVSQTIILNYSQSRGINIPLNGITRIQDGDNIKKKYWSRKGFQKAYEEMNGISNYVMTRTIAKRAIKTCPKIVKVESDSKRSQTKPTRRSPRLEKQKTEINSCIAPARRSTRIAQRALKKWMLFFYD